MTGCSSRPNRKATPRNGLLEQVGEPELARLLAACGGRTSDWSGNCFAERSSLAIPLNRRTLRILLPRISPVRTYSIDGCLVSLPEFTATGDLPVGVHEATLAVTIARFGTASNHRKVMALRLERVHRIASQTGHLARFIVFGSFVTDKREPNDVDIFMIMDDNFNVGSLVGEARLLFGDHSMAQSHFGASVFWIRRMAALGGEQSAIEDWQVKRDGSERGIVEIKAERT